MLPFILVFVALSAALPVALKYLKNALTDKRKSFARARENEIITIVKQGAVVKMIANIRDHDIDADYNVISAPGKRSAGDVHWIGLYPFYQVYGYNFSWSKYAQPNDGTVGQVIPMGDTVYSMYWRFTYAILVSVRTEDEIPGKVLLLVEMETVNPYTALFVVRKWLDFVTALIESRVNRVMGSIKFEDVASPEKWPLKEKEMLTKILALNENIEIKAGQTDPLGKEAGVIIRNATYIRLITTESAEMNNLQLTRALGQANADSLEALIKAGGAGHESEIIELAKTNALADAMKETKAGTIVIGGSGANVSVGGDSKKRS